MSVVIKVENLSKYYRLGVIGGGTLREDLSRWWAMKRGKPDPLLKIGEEDHGNRKDGQIWALRDVNFEVREGEILGIIGRNGAGKSTLLKILSRITDPSSGFRAFNLDVLSSVYLYEDQYHTSELIINAAKKGISIGEVPITIHRRKYGKSKKGKDWKYGFHFSKTIVKSWWR